MKYGRQIGITDPCPFASGTLDPERRQEIADLMCAAQRSNRPGLLVTAAGSTTLWVLVLAIIIGVAA
jgi:hypothetical protein